MPTESWQAWLVQGEENSGQEGGLESLVLLLSGRELEALRPNSGFATSQW